MAKYVNRVHKMCTLKFKRYKYVDMIYNKKFKLKLSYLTVWYPGVWILTRLQGGAALHCTSEVMDTTVWKYVLHCTALHCTVLYIMALYCTALHCIVLYIMELYLTVLYCM